MPTQVRGKTCLNSKERQLLKQFLNYDVEELYLLLGQQIHLVKLGYEIAKKPLKTIKTEKRGRIYARKMLSITTLHPESLKDEARAFVNKISKEVCEWWYKNKNKLEKLHSLFRIAEGVYTVVKATLPQKFADTAIICATTAIVVMEGLDRLCSKDEKDR